MKVFFRYFISCLLVLSLGACQKLMDIAEPAEPKLLQIPKGFPSVEFPSGNEYTHARWLLGKKLFYDRALSLNFSVSCASCHKSEFAFSDTVALSVGEHQLLGRSNAPSLANIAFHPYFTRAGGVPTLEMQVLVPVQEHDEFDFNIVEIAKRLSLDSTYNAMSLKAYDRPIDVYAITRALANFERSLISSGSNYDQYLNGNTEALSAKQVRGMQLFYSDRTHCSSCHSGILFTDFSFQNNGLYNHYADTGRMRLTGSEADKALFKVPALRNIAVTAPYMHDGSMRRLEDVVAHYNSGGKAHSNKSPLIHSLELTEKEQEELIAFLKSLTDYQFINNQQFKQ